MFKTVRHLLLIFCLSAAVHNVYGQGELMVYDFQGTVYDKVTGEIIEGYEVEVYQGNSLFESLLSEKKGRFNSSLYAMDQYVIVVQKEGYYSKRIIVNTSVPEGVKKLPEFKFDLQLISLDEFEEVEKAGGFGTSILDMPYVIFQYDEEYEDFGYIEEYTENMKAQYEALYLKEDSLR